MILLAVGTGMLARLMASDPRGPDSAWLLEGPTEEAVAATSPGTNPSTPVAEQSPAAA